MDIRVCPRCDRAFYFLSDRDACPHCGQPLKERRSRKRVKKELELTLSLEGSTIKAKTIDYSSKGAGIIYRGRALRLGSAINVTIGGSEKKAAAVWIKRITERLNSAGLRLF